jgi:molybdopterin/thiamine biosynthesis adenylyltransferase/rhodanese-related sulfurtransferase
MSKQAGLSSAEVFRYSRHLILPEVGLEGQEKLKAARVLLVGAGGLGSPVALYLAAAGVGHLGIVDFDVVDETNLQRQVLHGTRDVGRPKLQSAQGRIADLNPHVEVTPYEVRLTSANALEILRGYDVVIDGTDNFATRYLTNDACVLLGIPNVYGSIFRFEGQVSVFATSHGPCYRCLFREPPPPGLVPSCAEGGVLGVLPGTIGTLQATEAIKVLLGIGEPLVGRLLLYDALSAVIRTVNVRKDPRCPACGTREIRSLIDYDAFCGVAADPADDAVPEITPVELAVRLRNGEALDLLDVREVGEWQVARIEQARLVPLATLPSIFHSLDPERDVVVHCKGGGRSARAVRQLRAAGFRRVWNLVGGIQRWSQDVDPSVPRY